MTDLARRNAANSVELLTAMRRALAEAETLPEITSLIERAEVIRVAARKAGAMAEVQNDAAAYKLDAERKAGQMLAEMDIRPGRAGAIGDTASPKAPKLADVGVSKQQSARWQQIASIPDEEFEEFKAEARAKGEITEAGALRLARQTTKAAKVERIASAPVAELPQDVTYPVLLADPPWRYDYAETSNRQIENHYPTMSVDEIAALDVPAADDAVLFCWATSPKLREAFEVLDGWGFTYKTSMVWIKDKIGMGYYARQQHELILIATRGNLPVPDPANRPSSVIDGRRSEHSAKPEAVHDAIERMYPDYRRVELFARAPRDGWTVWGNQAGAA